MPTNQPEEKFTRIYEPVEGGSFKYTTTVRHQGTVIALTMDDQQKIFYSVLNFERGGIESPLDVNYWDNDPLELRFPNELGQVGARAAGLQFMPTVLKNGAVVPEGTYVEENEKDYFLSTTARLSADAPFKALSDGEHIYLFRQAVASTNTSKNIYVEDSENNDVAVVDRTLLVDRFTYRNGQLGAKFEVRFQRSRRIDRPASRKDTLGFTDLENKPFYEPTLELDFIRNLTVGNFTIDLLPTALPKVERWQIFAYNSASERIDSFNIERASDGLFNTQGTRYFTSPDPRYQNDVFEREPGTDPFTGEALVPKLSTAGFAEFALNLNGVADDAVIIDFDDAPSQALSFPSIAFTVECWIKSVGATDGTILSYATSDSNDVLAISDPSNLEVMVLGESTGATGISIAGGSWHHLAVSWNNEDGQVNIFVDGRNVNPDGMPALAPGKSLPGEGVVCIGQYITLDGGQVIKDHPFSGVMDDLRLWNRVRIERELSEEKNYRLIGNETDLVGYWRFDEGAGTSINDQTDNAYHGALDGEEPEEEDNSLDQEKLDASAMHFDGTVDETHHVYNPFDGFPAQAFTFEFWIQTGPEHKKMVPLSYANDDNDDAVYLFFNGDLRVGIYGQYSGPSEVNEQIRDGAWHHVALTWTNDSGELRLYIDGEDETPRNWAHIQIDHDILDGGSLVLGHEQEDIGHTFDQPFYGALNEVRIWNRVRSQAEIIADRDVRLDSFRNDLVFFMHSGATTRWIFSDAPIGDHPGVRRSSFVVEGRKIRAGMSSKFYYQQEQMSAGYNADDNKPMKRNGRLMLVASTVPSSNDGTEDYVAALDFGITKEGKLAQVPDLISMEVIDRPGGSQGGESIDILLEKLRQLREEQDLHISQIENTTNELDYGSLSYATSDEIAESIEKMNAEIDALGGTTDKDDEELLFQFDAVFGGEEDSGYVFLRGDQCLRTDAEQHALEGYPKPISEEWPALPEDWTSDFDAAYTLVGNIIEFFKGAERITYSVLREADQETVEITINDTVTDPELISERWDKLPTEFRSDIDAITRVDSEFVGIFKGVKYATVNLTNTNDVTMWPALAEAWPELPTSWYEEHDESTEENATEGINAITMRPEDNKFYLFRDYEFVAYHKSDTDPGPESDPALVDDDVWPGVIQLFGIESELDDDELRLQRFYYLKEKLGQLDDNYRRIEEIEAAIHSDIYLPMPLIHFDPDGQWTSGALLGFAWTADGPELFESVNGRLNLYFRGKKDQFFVAYYNVLTGRSIYSAQTEKGDAVDFVSRLTGMDGDHLSITIEDSSDAGACTVTISHENLGIQEIWLAVPREAREFAQVINGLDDLYDYDNKAHGYPGYFKPQNGSRLVAVIGDFASGEIENGAPAGPTEPTRSAQWFAASPGNALSFSGKGVYTGTPQPSPETSPILDEFINKFAVDGDVSMEAWINPVHSSDNVSRIIAHHSEESSYTLGLMKVTDSETAKRFDGSTSDAIIIPMDSFPTKEVTIEFWAQAAEPVGTRNSTLFSFASENSDNQFSLFNHKNFDLWIGNGDNSTGNTNVNALDFSPDQLQEIHDGLGNPWLRYYMLDIWNQSVGLSKWHHYAVTWQSIQDEETELGHAGRVQIFKDGELSYTGTVAPNQLLPEKGILVFGQDQDTFDGEFWQNRQRIYNGRFDARQALKGSMDEMRVWNVVRTQDEIKEFMINALNGNEAHLAGYWRLEGDQVVDLTPNSNNGVVRASNDDFSLISSPVQHFVGFAGVGERFAKTLDTLPPKRWQHLAAVYNQSYALDFDGVNDRVDCGSDITLDINGDLTVEAIITPTDLFETRGIVTRGRLADGTDEYVPYALHLNKEGRLVFSFEDESGKIVEITGPDKSWHLEWRLYWVGFPYRIPVPVQKDVPIIFAGQTFRVAVTREKKRDVHTEKDGDTIKSVNPREWWDINFYINGQPAGYVRYEGTVGSSNQPVEIGRAYDKKRQEFAHFKGQISEVRLWNQARDGGDIDGTDAGQEIKGNEKGLVSWWRFEENEGNVTLDSKSQNHGTRKGPYWVKNPDPSASKIYLYINGESTGTEDALLQDPGEHQFTIGLNRKFEPETQVAETRDQFVGWMDEIRIWKVARTQEQVQDNLFRRLIGERNQLIAHYDSDDPGATLLYDQSGRGLHLQLVKAGLLLSSAPISDETAAVRNALTGVKNNFHDKTQTRPGIQEYGDVQYDIDGDMIGVMKRCYSYVKNAQWHLVTGFKVGDLELEWIGQAQYDPQLIGYIEGAPPVPGENLSVRLPDKGQDYAKASSVELKSAESTLQSYSTTRDRGIDTSLSIKAGAGFKSESEAGFGVTTQVEDTNVVVGVKGNMETSNSWLDEQMVGTGETTTRLSSLEIQGAWEDEGAVKYPKMGRRYIPINVGFALVQSETADVFAMRLKHPDPSKRVVVGLRMQPNPDIPKDWNIIIFPLNNRYVKQGTLDGKVGLEADRDDYPNALTYSSNVSYFKPIEAYALKNRIEREREALNLLYKNYDVGPAGEIGLILGAIIGGGTGLAVGTAIAGLVSKQNLPDLSRRNMVNTYVWTADGGLFAETEETMDVMQEVVGGSFSLSGKIGLFADINTAISKVALTFELEAMVGGHLNLTNQKQEDSSNSFGMSIELDVEHDVNVQSQEQADLLGKSGMFDEDGNPIKAPGKVDAYRFMTFYLKPDKEHFRDFKNKVIDQEWLNSNDPNAVALNQAISKENGSPWRILHRVTYVSRVLPDVDSEEATPTDETLKAANIESNFELIRKIEPYVINKTGSYQEFTDAVRDTVRRHLPELSSAEDDIVDYMTLYFQVFEE